MSFMQGFQTSQNYFNDQFQKEAKMRDEARLNQDRQTQAQQKEFQKQEQRIANVLAGSAKFAKEFAYLKDTNPSVYQNFTEKQINDLSVMKEGLLGTEFEQYIPQVDATIAALQYGLSPRELARETGQLSAIEAGSMEKALKREAPATYAKEFPAPKKEIPNASLIERAIQDRAAGGVPSDSVYGADIAAYARSIAPEQAQQMVAKVQGSPTDVFGQTTNKQAEDLKENLIATKQAQDYIDRVIEIVDDPATATGSAADIVLGLGNVVGTVKQLAQAATGGIDSPELQDIANYDFSKFDKNIAESSALKSTILDLAYAMAAAKGQVGRGLSDKDVKAQLDILAANIANKGAMKRTLAEVKTGLSRNFNTRKSVILGQDSNIIPDLPETFEVMDRPTIKILSIEDAK